MTVNLSMLAGAGAQFFDNNGVILSGGLVYTYAAGTTTPQTAYTTSSGSTAHTNPIVLDSAGRVASGGEIWLTDAVAYKFVLKTSAGVTIGTYDNVTGNASGIYAAFAASSGSSLVGFIQSGGGAVATTVQAKLRQTVSVKDFGAVGNGVADDTSAVQNAVAYLGTTGGGDILFPPGTYFLSSTITLTNNVGLIGSGGTSCVLKRTGSYGDTIYQNTGFARIKGFFFQHGTIASAGSTTLDFLQTNSSAHIRLVNTQNSEIEQNILWRMPYGLVLDGAINTRVYNNWITGNYDPLYVAMQEGLADILFIGTSQHGQLAKISGNYFSGAVNSVRNTTYTDGVNSVVKNYVSNIGSKNSILCLSCEDLDISDNYFGRASYNLIVLNPGAGNNIILDVRIRGNLFDNVGSGPESIQIRVESSTSGYYVLGLNIIGNTFNGEFDTNNAVVIFSSPAPALQSAVNVQIANNTLFAHTATPIVLSGARGCVISGNTIQDYNSIQVALESSTNYGWRSAVFVYGISTYVLILGNIIGGGGTDMSDNQNYCWTGAYIDTTTILCTSRFNTYVGIKSGANFKRGHTSEETQYIHTVAGNYQMTQGLPVFVCLKTVGAATAVNLPIYPVNGTEALIKDGKGDAATNNIIIGTGDGSTIDGSASITITSNYGFMRFRFNGTQWNRVG